MAIFGKDSKGGVLDFLAGSTDEAVGRQFDSKPGGGIIPGVTSTADHIAGSTDEFVGRTFDDKPGGGAGDLGAWWSAAARAGDRGVGPLDEAFDNVAVDSVFQRPGELPGVSSEDSVDLPGGSVKNPTGDPAFQGKDKRAGPLKWLPSGGFWSMVPLAIGGFLILQVAAATEDDSA